MNGKDTCKTLKQIRKTIADRNGIPLEVEECTFEGDCSGTCPKCEAELRALENALEEKEKRGETVIRDVGIELPDRIEEKDGGADALRRSRRKSEVLRGKMPAYDMSEIEPPLSGLILPPPEEPRGKRDEPIIPEPLEGEPAIEYPEGAPLSPQSDPNGEAAPQNDAESGAEPQKPKTLLEKLRAIFLRKG